MADLIDIKDRTPNADLVRILKAQVKQAEAGELRSMVSVLEWDDGGISHGWVLSDNAGRRTIIGAVAELQFGLLSEVQLFAQDSPLHIAIFGEG